MTSNIVFKVMNSKFKKTVEVNELPESYNKLLELLKNINSEIHYSENNIIFCINGTPFDQSSLNIIYPTQKSSSFQIVVLVRAKKTLHTHNDFTDGVRSTVEGYATGNKTVFQPTDRIGNLSGVSLTIPEGVSIRDKNGNPIKIKVQTVNGPSSIKINGEQYRNVTRD